MAAADPGSLSQFLNYGGLGLLAILCLVVLGYNAWSLNGLVAKAEPKRVLAARPLLLAQMALSLVGLFAVGGGGIYLDQLKRDESRDKMESERERTAQITLEPWDSSLRPDLLPAIEIGGQRWTGRVPIQVACTPGRPQNVWIGLEAFIRHRAAEGLRAQRFLRPIDSAPVER